MIIKNGNQMKKIKNKTSLTVSTKATQNQLDLNVNCTAWKINPILPSKG